MHYRIVSDCVLTPFQELPRATIEIREGKIAQMIPEFILDDAIPTYDVRGSIVTPAFVNAHDHFLGTWLPKVGRGNYHNWAEWNVDLKQSDVLQERAKTTDGDRYLLGAYKTLCAGATTVSDHIPHHINDPYASSLPIRLHKNYCLAHAVSNLRLDWGDGIRKEFAKSNGKIPFITHLNEGFDPDTRDEVNELYRLGALQANTVLIHGIALTQDNIELVGRQGASLVWCPDSNWFMFSVTANIPAMIKAGVNVCLGTDSCATGSLHLMNELDRARAIAAEWSFGPVTPQQYLHMVTINPARALKVDHELGSIEVGKLADILILQRTNEDALQSVISAQPIQIELVTMNGQPMLGHKRFAPLFAKYTSDHSEVKFAKQPRLIVGQPLKIVKRVRQAVGYHKELPFLPFA